MNEIKIFDKITIEEFIDRLPPFIAEAWLINYEKQELLLKQRCYLEYFNAFAWARCKEELFGATRWNRLYSQYERINIYVGILDIKITIKVSDYYCRNHVYKKCIQELKKLDIFVEDLSNFKMEFAK